MSARWKIVVVLWALALAAALAHTTRCYLAVKSKLTAPAIELLATDEGKVRAALNTELDFSIVFDASKINNTVALSDQEWQDWQRWLSWQKQQARPDFGGWPEWELQKLDYDEGRRQLAERSQREWLSGLLQAAEIPHFVYSPPKRRPAVKETKAVNPTLSDLLMQMADREITDPLFDTCEALGLSSQYPFDDKVTVKFRLWNQRERLERIETNYLSRRAAAEREFRECQGRGSCRGQKFPTLVEREREVQEVFEALLEPIVASTTDLFYSTQTKKLFTENELRAALSGVPAAQKSDLRVHCDPVSVARIVVRKMHDALEMALAESQASFRRTTVERVFGSRSTDHQPTG